MNRDLICIWQKGTYKITGATRKVDSKMGFVKGESKITDIYERKTGVTKNLKSE